MDVIVQVGDYFLSLSPPQLDGKTGVSKCPYPLIIVNSWLCACLASKLQTAN